MSDASKLAGFLNAQIRELTERRDAAIRQAIEGGDTLRAVAADTGLHFSGVNDIVRRGKANADG